MGKGIAAVLLFALCVGLLTLSMAPEDSTWFNCHLAGNQVCGAGTPWHGFVNWR